MKNDDKTRQQYDFAPYPNESLDKVPQQNLYDLFIHDLTTSHYLRNRKTTPATGRAVLDLGCGSGFKTLLLAQANPQAEILGVDFSEKSIQQARKRLETHSFNNVRFEVLSIEDLSNLNLAFDYINCDEVLYLLPDPVAALKQMRSALKPEGTLRANLHSSLQRQVYLRGQELFKMTGLMETLGAREIALAAHLLEALKDNVDLKKQTALAYQTHKSAEFIAVNFLLQNDKGYTIPEMFSMLDEAGLDFVSMVNAGLWNYLDLFKRSPELLSVFGLNPANLSRQQQLHIFELLHPTHRLLDFWCGHPKSSLDSVSERSDADWAKAQVQLHPQLQIAKVKAAFLSCLKAQQPLNLQSLLEGPIIDIPLKTSYWLESNDIACLLPLQDGPQSLSILAERWAKLHPLHPVSLEPFDSATALADTRKLLAKLEDMAYVFIS